MKVKNFVFLVCFILIGFFLGIQKNNLRTLLVSPANLITSSANAISVQQLVKMLKTKNLPSGGQSFTLINVHTPYESEIEQTDTFIPFDQIVANVASLPKDKTAPIVLYCKTGRMSNEAINTIRKLGYTNVRHVAGGMDAWKAQGKSLMDLSTLESDVLPQNGVELPVSWGDLWVKLVAVGVIDLPKLKDAVHITPEQEKILTQGSSEHIKIDRTNGQFIVDMLWALGLAQKSMVYDEGPMGKEYKKDVGNFASTGGWTLTRGNATQYLNTLDLIPLTIVQHRQVAEIAKHIYRPCCGNSTWFPDCNHGMAALAAIELMVAAGLSEQTIYRNVLTLNSYWFADTYLSVATSFARRGTPWSMIDAKLVLGENYSSAKGAHEVAQKVGPLPYKQEEQGSGCGA